MKKIALLFVVILFAISASARHLNYQLYIYDDNKTGSVNPSQPSPTTIHYQHSDLYDGKTKIDTSFVYCLPYSIYKNDIKFNYNINISEYITKNIDQNYISLYFSTERGDTILNSRKGYVLNITNKYQTANTSDIIHTTIKNEISIQHKDGSIARYVGVEKDGFMVKIGDQVIPGTPLGKAAKVGDYTGFYFSVYLKEKNLYENSKAIYTYTYINPVFSTAEGHKQLLQNKSYLSFINNDIITAEMSDREKRKYLTKNPTDPIMPDFSNLKQKSSTNNSPALEVSLFFAHKGEAALDVIKNRQGIYSILFDFTIIDNYKIPSTFVDSISVSRRILNIPLEDNNRRGYIKYRYTFSLGIADRKPDNVTYLLPFSKSKKDLICRAYENNDITFIHVQLEKGDTVFSVRKGMVVSASQLNKSIKHSICIQHDDGSIILYSNLDEENIMVKEGDEIEAYSPIGIIDGNQAKNKLILYPIYLNVVSHDINNTKNKTLTRKGFNIIFATDKGDKIFEDIGKRYSHR